MSKAVYFSGEKGKGKFAIVDDADYELVKNIRWFMNNDGYAIGRAVRGSGGKNKLMHRFIMDAPPEFQVDHVNGDRLDNRRENLRFCDTRLNNRNMRPGARGGSSRFKGVHFCNEKKKWTATIKGVDRRYHLGRFDDEIEAARAYDAKAKELFGEFFRPNLPEEQ